MTIKKNEFQNRKYTQPTNQFNVNEESPLRNIIHIYVCIKNRINKKFEQLLYRGHVYTYMMA